MMKKLKLLFISSIFILNASDITNPEQVKLDRIDGYTKLNQVLLTIENRFVDEIKFNKLIDKTISGLLTNLDSHSSYLDKKKLKEFKISTNGEFGGIGIVIGMKDNLLTIISPIEDTPGDKIGLKSGDKIVKINGESSIDFDLDESISRMRGKADTDVELTIIRKGEKKPIVFNIKREIIKIKSVKSKFIEKDNFVYLRISTFDKHVTDLALQELKKYKNIKGIILDLRNNPGGLLNQAIGLTNLFIDNGIIVQQKSRIDSENIIYNASPDNAFNTSTPLVVLINEGSASASEIVSGALQDHKRAILIGKETFGKGSVQTIMPLNNEEAIKLTIARYFLPSGRTIQAKGVKPDLEVLMGSVLQDEDDLLSFKEKDLKNHLKSQIEESEENSKNIDNNIDSKNILDQKDILKDNQLNSAIDTLRVLNIINK